jgi:hypothetical protein
VASPLAEFKVVRLASFIIEMSYPICGVKPSMSVIK